MLDSIFSYNNPDSFVNRLRKNRFTQIHAIINALIEKKGTIRILDLGGDISYWENMNWKNTSTQSNWLNDKTTDPFNKSCKKSQNSGSFTFR